MAMSSVLKKCVRHALRRGMSDKCVARLVEINSRKVREILDHIPFEDLPGDWVAPENMINEIRSLR